MTSVFTKLRTGPYRYRALSPPLPRRIHAYSVGASKSGTSSLHGVFSGHFKSAHEPAHGELIDAIIEQESGALSRSEMQSLLRRRDKRLRLEMDSSALNGLVIADLVETFPRALFILTIRDCYSWLDSLTNHYVTQPSDEHWKRLRARPSRNVSQDHPAEEYELKERGIAPIDRLLSNWARHNQRVLDSVPEARLLVVKTGELSNSLGRIADFLSIDERALVAGRSHAFKRSSSEGPLDRIDSAYLDEKVCQHCKPLMERFFPEVSGLQKASRAL